MCELSCLSVSPVVQIVKTALYLLQECSATMLQAQPLFCFSFSGMVYVAQAGLGLAQLLPQPPW